MLQIHSGLLATIAIATLAGCATIAPPDAEPVSRIDADSYRLLAELALTDERFTDAAEHLLNAALASSSPNDASRAARLAYELGLDTIGVQATARWRELEPDSRVANYFSGIFATRTGRVDTAVEQFSVVLDSLGQAALGQGFAQIVDALVGEPSATNATLVMRELTSRYPPTREGHYGLAQLALRAGAFGVALEESAAAVELAPEWPEAQLLYARTLLVSGRSREALAIARELAEEYDNVPVRLEFAQLLLSAGETEQAQNLLNEILEDNPGMPEAIRALAFLALAQQDLELARSQFEILRADASFRNETFYFLGRIAELESDYFQAMRSYSRVTDGPRAVEAQARVASIMLEEMDDPDSALAHLEQFGSESPRFASEMLLARAELLLRLGRPEEGMNLIDGAVAAAGEAVDQSLRLAHVSFYSALMEDAIARGDLEGAEVWIDEGLQHYPEEQSLRYSKSRLLQEQGELRRSVRILDDLVEESPDDPTFLNALGYLLTDRLDRHSEARTYIQRALAMDPENGAILDSMGWVLYKLGELDLALDYLERAYRALEVTEVLAHLVDVHWAMGNREQARDMLREGLEFAPEDSYLNEVRDRLLR